jgi:hypothetical protein
MALAIAARSAPATMSRAALTLLLLAATLSTARAETTSLRWKYARGPGAEECPDAETLRSSIAAELGRDPFDAASERGDLVVDVRRARGRLAARIELHGSDGALVGARTLRSGDCRELTPALTLAVALAVDALESGHPDTQPADVEVTQAGDDEAPHFGLPAARARGYRLRVGAGFLGGVDATLLASFGLTAQADIAFARWSAGLELRGDLPTSTSVPSTGYYVTASLWRVAAIPCFRHKLASVCAIVAVGNERASAGGVNLSAVWVGLGGRLALELPLYSRFVSIRLHADVVAPATRNELVSPGGKPLYATAAVSGSFGMALLANFL